MTLTEGASASSETTGNIWIKPLTTGNQGTKTVGDTMGQYYLNFEIGQSSWNKSEVGIGLSTGTVWGDFNWGDATYYQEGESSGNKRVRRDLAGFQFTQAGQYNVIYAAKNAAGDNSTVRCAGDWVNYTTWLPTDFGETYFTVNAIDNPSPSTPTAPTGAAEGRQGLSWSKNTAGHNVMIVRYASGVTPTAPTGGTAYSSGNTIGSGTVVYNGNGTSTTLTSGLTAGTTYDYWFYSVNGNYYSSGTKVSGTASKAPRFGTTSVSKTTTVGTAVSNTQTASGTPSTMTYSVTCTSGGAASSTYSVNSSGVFSFTPAAAGTFVFTVSASNGVGTAATYTITVTVAPVAPTLTLSGQTAVSISGTVGCLSGATVTLKRYATSEAASSDTGGTAVSTSGTGTSRTFTDSGLDSCTTYYYKAWQTSGGQTSAASDVKSRATDGPAAPDVTPSGAGGEISLSWSAVPGAVSYKVNVCEVASAGTSSRALSDYTGTGTFGLITSASDFTDGGLYVIVGNGTTKAMNGTVSSSSLTVTDVGSYFSGGNIVNPPAAVVWKATASGGNFTLRNAESEGYATGSTSASVSCPASAGTHSYWTVTSDGETFRFTDSVTTSRALFYRDTDVFKNYGTGNETTTGYARPLVYKLGAGASCVATDVSVTGTSVTFDADDGVETGKTYSWSVASVGAGGCDTEQDEGTVYVDASTPTLTVDPTTLALGSTTYGTAGSAYSFTVSGADLTTDVTVTPPAGVSVCLTSGGTYQTTALTVTEASAEAPGGATVYVKLTGASVVASLSDNVTVASTGATTVNVSVSGTVTAVLPTVGSPTRTSLTTTGATLGGTVTANGGATLTEWGVVYSATSKNTTPTVGGTGCTNLTASGTPSLAAFTRAVSGLSPNTEYKWRAYARNSAGYGYTAVQTFTTPAPTLTVSPASVTDMAGVQYQDGTPANVSVSGANMMGNVTVAVTSGFEVSTDGGSSWGTEKSITVAGATLTATTVKVRIASGSGTGAVTGTLTVSSSNAASVTVSLAGSVSGATVDTGSWLGNSYLVLNGDWYNGSGSDNTARPASLGYLTTLTLGAQVQTYGQNDGETYPAYMTYSIDSGAETTVALVWFRYNDENHNNYFGMGGTGGQHVQTATTLDLSGLASGEHTLHVYFSQPTSVGSGTLYDDSSTKVTYNVTFVVPAWNGPNTVYWRDEAVNGHFVRQDDDGNHDPWWYQITPTVGFHNPNMTDHGPNDIIFNNNIQLSMTNDAASTVNSITFTSSSSSSRTIRGSQTLTVNSSITNMGGTMNFRVPLAFGGDVTVTNSSSKSIYFYSAVNGNGHTLTKKGAGVLYIANAVTVGGATVAAGRLALNVGGSLSSDVSLTASSAVFSTYPQNAANVVDYAGVISGTGQVLKQGSGTTTLSGNNTYSGKTSVTNGTLIVGHANALGSGKSDVHVGLGTAKLKVGDGVTRVAAKSLNFIAADSELVTGAGKVVAVTNNAVIKKVSFDAGNYSGDDTQWAIVTSANGTITQSGDLTVVNGPATGRFELELASDNKTLYVTYHKPPAAPSLTVSTVTGNGGQLSGTATPPSGADVVVVRYATATYGTPSGSTLPSLNADWADGKVVSVTSGAFTDTGLTGCTTYYYKAWSLKNGLWSEGATGSAATDTPAAPVLNAIADATTTHNQFVATWNAVPGAATYRMDVVKGGAATTPFSCDFNDNATGWTFTRAGRYDNSIRVGTGDYPGTADSPTIDLSGSGGNATLAFDAWSYSSDTECILHVWFKASSSADWAEVTDTLSIGSSSTPYSFALSGGTATSQIRFTTDVKKKRVCIDNVVVTQGGSSPVTGWTDRDVGSLMTVEGGVVSVTVTGLSEETAYSVTVRSEGATSACASGDSNTESVTTKQDTSATTVTIADANATGAASAVAAGNVLAGQTVLVQGTKLTVASGSVNPTLTGMTFTTTGSATGSDIGTYRVKVTTSGTWAAGETGLKGTVTAGAAGSHSVTFGSAQTLTAGTTYYVWIEAVTLAEATAERTVGVSALTGDNFTMTSARKQGSTSATGAQTIYGAPTVSLTPGASGSATISGTVSGLATGATVELRRYESAEAAAGDTTGTAGTAVTVTSGAFSATGLEACRPYWFKARQTLNGYTGAWGATQTAAAPGLTAPTGLGETPTTTGAALSWNAVAGAGGYSVDVWHYEGGGGAQTVTYTVDGKTSVTTSGTAPEGSSATFAATYGTLYQITKDNSQTLTLSGFGGVRILGITLSIRSNGSSGGGTLTLKVGDNEAQTLASGKFNTSSWNGEWSSSFGNIVKNLSSAVMVDDGESVVIKILGSESSLYCQSYTVKYESGTPVNDVTAGVPASGVTFSQSGTGATVGGLAPNSEYGWSVAATGFGGCAGDATTDSFTTLEVAGAPVISTPLTSAVEQLSGTISGTPGATMILKRYETAEAAAAGGAGGALGGVSVPATEGTGAAAGTWTFTDTGLDGCKTYYYKAWQKVMDGGVEYTSAGSNVASAQTGLGTPTVNAVGAGTQMTISWNAVPGAVSYYLEVATDTRFTRPTSGAAVLTEDFAGFTGTAEVTTLDGKTGVTGWSGSKVYAGAGTARLGTSNNSGYLTTPRIAAQSGGGTVYFDLKQWTATEGATLTVQISYPEEEGEDEEWIDLKTVTPTADFDTYSVALPAGAKTSDFWICFDTVSSKRVYIDNVRVVPLGAGSAGSLKYEATVTGAPLERTADGLEVGTTYYYRVTTTGEEECTTVTDIGSALTADAPIIQVSPKHYNFGTVNKNEGGKTATFTVRNTGSVVLKFNSVALVQDGTAYRITSPAGAALTADLGAGQSRTYTVLFNPTNSGPRTATLRFGSDAFNVTGEIPPASGTPTYGNFDVPLEGTCYDPATAEPTVYWLEVEDELRIEDTVTDHSMAQEADEPVLTVLAWHYNRTYRTLDRSSKAAKWTLYDPNGDVVVTTGGTRLENQFFTAVEDYVYDGKTCAKFSAPIPALGNGNAIRGTYHVKVKVYDSTGTYFTETTQFVPVETGWLFEDFTRADTEATGSGALENGWTAMASGGAVVGEAAIHADALELYGANGEFTGEAGRIAVVRDMSDVGYATNPHDFEGTGSWGFHFKTGAKTVGFANESTAGAFVLGSTEGTWLASSDDQVGYAVAMMDNAVRLVKFQGSLLAGGTITQLGSAQFSGAQGKLLAVRVDFVPGQDAVDEDAADDGVAHAAVPAKYRLYVKEVASTGGNPIAECTAADKVLEWEFPSVEDHDLKFGGMMWNHGVAQAGDKTGAMFDDIYLPHMTSQTEPMMFHVIDQDTEGPVFEDFDLPAAIAASTVNGSGLTVHGTVKDPSGIWTAATGASAPSWDSHAANPKWELWVNGVMKADGTPTSSPNGNGAGTEVAWTINIPSGLSLSTTTDCELRLSAWDHDTDRQDDSMQGTAALQFTLCATTPTAPGWATVEGDGAEVAVLRWAHSGGTYVVVRSDEEIGERATPPQGETTAPVEGTTTYEGLGKVVYKGTGDEHLTGTWTAREFIVKPGSSNYFAVYGMTGDGETGYYFSAPTLPKAYQWTTATTNAATGDVTVTEHTAVDGSGMPKEGSVADGAWPLVTPKYEPGEGVDSFAYRTSVCAPDDGNPEIRALLFNYETRPDTGSGWGGPWGSGYGDAPDKWKVHDSSLLTGTTHYPAATGNKLYWKDTSTSSADEAKLTRNLDSANSGDLFVACILNYQYGGDNKWVTLGLLDADGHTLVSFGKQGGNNWNYAAISTVADNGSPFGDHRYQGYSPRELEPGHGNDYVVVGQLSRSEHKLRMWVFSGSDRIPEIFHEEPATDTPTALECVQADCDYSESLTVPAVAAIQLCAGSTADANTELGHVYFDEVRFAGTWEELFLFNAPEVYTFDFDKPENTTGIMVGTDTEGHRLWRVSDGALAHGNVGLNAQFGLYHRSGIQTASFTIKDDENHTLLKQASDLAPEIGGAAGRVTLAGRTGQAFSDWKTGSGGATGVAIPTNWIALDSNYVVEVTLRSTGGKEAVVTAASESGGAGSDELFFGEYGENTGYDNYLEIYNGTGHTIDLSDYWIVKMDNVTDPDEMLTKFANTANWADNNHAGRIGAGYVRVLNGDSVGNMASGETSTSWPEGPFKLPHRATVCIVPNNAGTSFVKALLGNDCRVIALNVQGPMAVSGDDPQMLMYKEGATTASQLVGCEWIDMAGLTKPGRPSIDGDEGQYIMYRLESTVEVPRRYPKVVNWDEWDYRNWLAEDKVEPNAWSNLLATAGAYDKNIGLGGNMEFMVYDDDIEPPTMVRGGLRVRKADGSLEEEYREVSAGDRTFVVGGWSFTNWPAGKASASELTLEDYQWIASMWPGGLTQNGGVSWSSELGGTDLAGWANVIEAGNNKGQSNVEFDGISQRKYGNMVARASASYAQDDEVWLGFDLDVAQLTEGVLSFGFAGGNAGFKSARVEWSATGEEGSFKMPNEWNFDPNSGGATTWTEWSRSLDPVSTGIPASAGHLWFRVYLSDYGTTSGTFRMDNIRVEGAPSVVRVTDAEICNRGMQFEVHVKDEASGLDAGTDGPQSGDDGKAYFDCGLEMDEYRTVSLSADGGKSESTISWTAAMNGSPVTTGWGPLTAQNWYEETQAGHGKLRMSVPDKDDDRPNDQTMLSTDFGMLMVEDDDSTPPVLEMDSMKPRQEGTMAEWLLAEKTTLASETMEALVVGALGLNTTEGTTSRPRYSLRSASDTGLSAPTYAVYQSGWQAGSKFWTVKIRNTSAGAGTITKISFASQVGSVLAPTGYTVKYAVVSGGVSGSEAGTTWSDSLLTSGTAWVKEGAEGATGSPIKTWVAYEKTVEIPLAASGSSGDEVELRIYGTGTDPKGIGATWYLWNLKIEGTISVPGAGGEDGYTYVTDNTLAQPGGASLPMSGSVYDAGSGLGGTPWYELKRGSTTLVASNEISFTDAWDLSARTTKAAGAFSQDIAVRGMGYGDLALTEYKGTVHAVDADADRNSAADGSGTNYDALEMDGQFAFTVIDQDLVGPSAPTNLTVNGTEVRTIEREGTRVPQLRVDDSWVDLTRDNATWTNKPEFIVAFDVAEDIEPTPEQLTGTDEEYVAWRAAHGVTNGMVKKASLQTGVAGVGEYRVALATNAVALSNAPAFSVAVTNGALANYGFERYADTSWTNPDGDSGINKGNNVGGSYPVAEGTNSYYLRAYSSTNSYPTASQIIPFAESDSDQTLTVDLSLKIYKRAAGSIVYAKFEFSNDEESWTSAINDVGLNSGASGDPQTNWLSKTMATKTLTAPAGAKYLRFSLRMNANTANIDDVRLSVRVGAAPAAGTADRATMRYEANAAAQGLDVKYLFAADADNDRAQDRMVGETEAFFTAYDCTPPTPIGKSTARLSANPQSTDDPTSQFDLTWSSANVGPDDPANANHPTGTGTDTDVLSPWETYKFYFRAYEPTEWRLVENTETDGAGPTSRGATRDGGESDSVANYINTQIIATRAYTNSDWSSVTRYSEIADPSVTTNYTSLGFMNTHSNRLYDLENDREYVVVIVGVDKAGNEGPANQYSWVTNNTIKFAITQGVMRAWADIPEGWLTNQVKAAAALYWTASVSGGQVMRDYALIYRDARSFSESKDNKWTAVTNGVKSNWFVDAGALRKEASNIRFYRAAYKDRWKDKVEVSTSGRRGETEVVTQRPLMSEDVYAMTAVPLVSNANYVSLHGFGVANGETNTLGAIFGTDTNIWQSEGLDGVNLDVYTAGFHAGSVKPDHTYYLVTQNGTTDWHRVTADHPQEDGRIWTHYVDEDIFRHGVSIKMPEITEPDLWVTNNGVRQPAVYWHPVLLVPTNSVVCQSVVYDNNRQVVSSLSGPKEVDFRVPVFAGSNRADVVWNFCSFTLPVAFHPSQLGLEAAGFVSSTKPTLTPDCDILYAYDSVTKSLRHGSGMFLGTVSSTNENLVWRSILGNHAVVTGKPFYPNDVLVINSRSSATATDHGTWTWTYDPTNFYTPPTRWGGW